MNVAREALLIESDATQAVREIAILARTSPAALSEEQRNFAGDKCSRAPRFHRKVRLCAARANRRPTVSVLARPSAHAVLLVR